MSLFEAKLVKSPYVTSIKRKVKNDKLKIIKTYKIGLACDFLQLIDRTFYKSSPVLATGVVLASIYWSATTYGAISLMQVFIFLLDI